MLQGKMLWWSILNVLRCISYLKWVWSPQFPLCPFLQQVSLTSQLSSLITLKDVSIKNLYISQKKYSSFSNFRLLYWSKWCNVQGLVNMSSGLQLHVFIHKTPPQDISCFLTSTCSEDSDCSNKLLASHFLKLGIQKGKKSYSSVQLFELLTQTNKQ